MWYVIFYTDHCCLPPLGLEGRGANICLLEARLCQQLQKLPHADQMPDSHLNGAVSFLDLYKTFTRKHSRINYGNVSAWVDSLAQRLTFLVWIHSPLRGIRGCDCCSRRGTLQMAVWSQRQGVQIQVVMPWRTTTGDWALCHLFQSHHKTGAEKAGGQHKAAPSLLIATCGRAVPAN